MKTNQTQKSTIMILSSHTTMILLVAFAISIEFIAPVYSKTSTKVKCYSPSSQTWYYTDVDELGSNSQQQMQHSSTSSNSNNLQQTNKPSIDSIPDENTKLQFVSGNGVDECYFVKENFINGNHATYVEPPADFKPIIYDQNQQQHQQNLQKERLDEEQYDQQQQLNYNQIAASASSLVPTQASSLQPNSVLSNIRKPQQSPMRWSEWKDMSIEPEFAASLEDSYQVGATHSINSRTQSSRRQRPSASKPSSHYQFIFLDDMSPIKSETAEFDNQKIDRVNRAREVVPSNAAPSTDDGAEVLMTADDNSVDHSLRPSTILYRNQPYAHQQRLINNRAVNVPISTSYYEITPEEAAKLEYGEDYQPDKDNQSESSQNRPQPGTTSDVSPDSIKNPSTGNIQTTYDDERPIIMIPPAMYRKRVGSSLKVVTIQRNPKKHVKKSIKDNGIISHGQYHHHQQQQQQQMHATKLSTSADTSILSQINSTLGELPTNSVPKPLSPSQSISNPLSSPLSLLGQKSSHNLDNGVSSGKTSNANGGSKKSKRRRKSKSNKEVRLLLNSNASVAKSSTKISQKQLARSVSNGQTVSSNLVTTGSNDMSGSFGIKNNNVESADLQQFKQQQQQKITSAARLTHDPRLPPLVSRAQQMGKITRDSLEELVVPASNIGSLMARRADNAITKERLLVKESGLDSKNLTAQDQSPTVNNSSITRKRRNRIRTLLPVGLTSWFLGGIRDLDGRHWHLPASVMDKLAVNDVDFVHAPSTSASPIASVQTSSGNSDNHADIPTSKATIDFEFIKPR